MAPEARANQCANRRQWSCAVISPNLFPWGQSERSRLMTELLIGPGNPIVRGALTAAPTWLAADESAYWFPCRAQGAPRSVCPLRTLGRARIYSPPQVGRCTDLPGREQSRLVATVRACSSGVDSVIHVYFPRGERSRMVASIRDCSHLLDVGNVAVHGVGGNQIFSPVSVSTLWQSSFERKQYF
jgi:hypothetical protein